MEPDDEICLCFHVSKRKVINFLRRERPVRASQLSECFGAGTGCGWCRPLLERLWQQSQKSSEDLKTGRKATSEACSLAPQDAEPRNAAQWKQQRADYLARRNTANDSGPASKD